MHRVTATNSSVCASLAHQDSEEVVHVTDLGVLNRTNANIAH